MSTETFEQSLYPMDTGLNFNAFHWYAGDGAGLDGKLAAAPYLKLATLNGSRRTGEGPGATLEPLDQGELDLFSILGALRLAAGFRGKIGFQGYSWGGDIHAKLDYLKLAPFRSLPSYHGK